MNNLFIHTQYLENYGTHDAPYMKFKGGNTYVMKNCGEFDKLNCGEFDRNLIASVVAQVKPYITTDLLKSNGGCEEYVTDVRVLKTGMTTNLYDITPTEFHIYNGSVNFMKVTDNREDGWMKNEILEMTESWTNERDSGTYKVSYLMEDGDFCESQDELKAWFTTKEVA